MVVLLVTRPKNCSVECILHHFAIFFSGFGWMGNGAIRSSREASHLPSQTKETNNKNMKAESITRSQLILQLASSLLSVFSFGFGICMLVLFFLVGGVHDKFNAELTSLCYSCSVALKVLDWPQHRLGFDMF